MIAFLVVKENFGWSVRTGACMSTPFRLKDRAVGEARRLANGLRRHCQNALVIVEGEAVRTAPGASAATPATLLSPVS